MNSPSTFQVGTEPELNYQLAPQPAGLSSAEVAERVARGETNAVRQRFDRTYWQIVRDNFFNLFNLVLLALVLVLFWFRDYTSIVFASFSVVTNSLIGTAQEISAKRALARLAALAVQDVTVLRDGKRQKIPISKVVKDDVLPIEPGDRLVADGNLLYSDSLEIDESLLTGESDAIVKETGSPVYSGSYCIAGSGIMVATQVGEASTVNKLATVAKAYRNVKTPTQTKIEIIVELAVVVMLIFGPMVIVTGAINRLVPLETVQNALVLVTSLVPQGLVISTTLALTLGALRISRHQTLVQRINAVESLAYTTVLCFDKTGTLTRNELAVVDLVPLNGQEPPEIQRLLSVYLANLSFLNKTAAAIADYCRANADIQTAVQPIATKQREIPFSSARKWGAVVLENQTLLLGAPERLLDPVKHKADLERAQHLAAEGLRVLAFAQSAQPPALDTTNPLSEPFGLVVMSDQVRDEIQQTLQALGEQGVEFKVISGDNQETVAAIAAQAGIKATGIYTGQQLEQLSSGEFAGAVQRANLFARIEPGTKRAIIAALKRQGAYVAMVGDGVNDVPALKEAHLAIAMNDGAQIAKSVADIVLLNNALSTLPLALSEGKSITQKIFATARLYLSKNIYQLMLFILVSFMSLPFPISPVQISWFGLIAVNLPATLIAFGVIHPALVRRFNREVLGYVVVSGVIGALGMALFYTWVYLTGSRDTATARSAVMLFMMLFGILIFLNTQGINLFRPRTIRTHWFSACLGVAMGAVAIGIPYLVPGLFRFVPPTAPIWILLIGVFGATATVLNNVLHQPVIFDRLKKLIA